MDDDSFRLAHPARPPPDRASESPAYLSEQLITYIGNKRSLLPLIGQAFDHVRTALGRDRISIVDLFSGSGIVSRYARAFASHVTANDLETYSCLTNRCYLSNRADVNLELVARTIEQLHQRALSEPVPGFITELYAPRNEAHIQPGERVFYTRRNAIYLDTVRQLIDASDPALQPYLLAPLLWQASVHVNTSGVFKGFYKNGDGVGQFGGAGRNALSRILRDIRLAPPILSNIDCCCDVVRADANQLIHELDPADLIYLDPPYNQHPYGSNYFMLNLLCDNQRPEALSPVSGIPTDWNRSVYNSRPQAQRALFDLVADCRARFVLLSYNSEGFISHRDFLTGLRSCGKVSVMDTAYNAFRGSRNLQNRDLHVTEYLYLVDKS